LGRCRRPARAAAARRIRAALDLGEIAAAGGGQAGQLGPAELLLLAQAADPRGDALLEGLAFSGVS